MARKTRKKELVIPEVILPPKLESRLQTAAYGRLSSENNGNETDDSLKNQMSIIEDYIENNPELELNDRYMDNGYTGTNFNRPEFQRMMNDVRSGKIQCIVVKDLSRFGRDYVETGYYMETILPLLNVRLIAVNDNYDSSRTEDRDSMSIAIKNLVNEMYAKDLSVKILAAEEARRCRDDVLPKGRTPFGYVKSADHTQYLVEPETAQYVRAAFQWVRMGVTCGEVSRRLTAMKVLTPEEYRKCIDKQTYRLKKWNPESMVEIIRNHVFCGDVCMGKFRQAQYRGIKEHMVDSDQWVIRVDAHEPLVSRQDFETIWNREGVSNCYSERFREYNILIREEVRDQMKGIVYCSECGRRMLYTRYCKDYSAATPEEIEKKERAKKSGNRKSDYYICPPLNGDAVCGGHKISADLLKMIVTDQIQLQMKTALDLKVLIENNRKMKQDKDPVISLSRKLTAIQGKITEAENRRISLYEDYTDGILSVEDYRILEKECRSKMDGYEKEKTLLENNLQKVKKQFEAFNRLCEVLKDKKIGMEFNEQLTHELVDQINISKTGEIEVQFSFRDTIASVIEALETQC